MKFIYSIVVAVGGISVELLGADRTVVFIICAMIWLALYAEYKTNLLRDLFDQVDPATRTREKSARELQRTGMGGQGSMMKNRDKDEHFNT